MPTPDKAISRNCETKKVKPDASFKDPRGKTVVVTTEIRAQTEANHIQRVKAAREAKDPPKEVSFLELNRQRRRARALKKAHMPVLPVFLTEGAQQPSSPSQNVRYRGFLFIILSLSYLKQIYTIFWQSLGLPL